MSKEKVGARRSDGPTRDGAEPEVCEADPDARAGGTQARAAAAPTLRRPVQMRTFRHFLDFGTVYARCISSREIAVTSSRFTIFRFMRKVTRRSEATDIGKTLGAPGPFLCASSSLTLTESSAATSWAGWRIRNFVRATANDFVA